MKTRRIFLVRGLAMLALPFAARAQPAAKIPRVGFMAASNRSAVSARVEAFREGLRELGYVDGKNIALEFRFAEGKPDRVPMVAAELVRSKIDVIVTGGALDTRAAREATTTIPIVMAQDNDPVESGFVASLARPGGNITGLSTLVPELDGKRLEVLKDTVPGLSRVLVLGTSTVPSNARSLRGAELAAGTLKLHLQYLDVLDPKDIEAAFRTAAKGRPQAVLVLGSPIFNAERARMADLAAKSRLPAIYNSREYIEAGGLMTYGASATELFRRAATYVDRILKGAKPGDLPVEQPTKFEFVVNLKAAKRIGLTVPQRVLARADAVIR
jgi:putative ABC transport system substrate-binding protein